MGTPFSPATHEWQSAVAELVPTALEGLYVRKFPITPDTAIMTAGSCFAQHVHRHLQDRAWNVIDTETPSIALPRAALNRYGYGLFSARYGNIYTARQMVQLLEEALGRRTPSEPIWQRDGRFFDALRPNVEPEGLGRPRLVREARADHLKHVLRAVRSTDVFVFTLGLTEAWVHRDDGTVYPSAPGILAGEHDPEKYVFYNFTMAEVQQDLDDLRTTLHEIKPGMKILLTVSPVPLTATGSGTHVLSATTYSKSVLRAAAAEVADMYKDVDYFPSYELITAPSAKGTFYDANLRTVSMSGVAAVMDMFLSAHEASDLRGTSLRSGGDDEDARELVCEEALIEAGRA
ncbi:GSCFA domain-containing protein [Celeribacter litoreus]|uniref:GSCFA domain-containing protein n=1 Tax=Celeribacter litoreus TaxID=2876714 RepID=UPI001CD03401|nr:GSCFA domain-containing protein [Celeribacter litoreus]MCA0044059.1 GSCFA domain-containing protein [Celeribacter litoreus]